jgi:hypothetical protein
VVAVLLRLHDVRSKVEAEVTASQNEAESAKWVDAMSVFLGRARLEVQKNIHTLDEVSTEIRAIMAKYAVEPSGSGADDRLEFLVLMNEFAQDWKKARDDNALLVR